MQEQSAMLLTEPLSDMNKQEIRKWARGKRQELDMEKISSVLVKKLVQTEEYKNSKNIMIFYPMSGEVNLLSLLQDKTKQFFLPRVEGKELVCCPYCAGDELCESKFHTQEPTCQACSRQNIDLVIVPAIACDKNGYRLGYGGGFYDRFLKDYDGMTMCCIPQELVLDNIYPEKHDIKINFIISGK